MWVDSSRDDGYINSLLRRSGRPSRQLRQAVNQPEIQRGAAQQGEAQAEMKATVIWRAFDDQFQSGFRIIMQNEAEKSGGITLICRTRQMTYPRPIPN